jgi:hypothetical protein
MRRARTALTAAVLQVGRLLLQPFGYLAFVLAVASLSACASLLGREHDLGGFAGRLAESIRRYPEVTRRGIRVAWILWAVGLAVSCSPLDPLATWWDEVALVAIAAGLLWHRLFTASHSS